MPPDKRCQVEAHEIHHGKELDLRLPSSVALGTIQSGLPLNLFLVLSAQFFSFRLFVVIVVFEIGKLTETPSHKEKTATAGSDVVQSGRPIFDDFFQHLWPYIGNNSANVVFQMVKRLWLIRIDQ
ncbi:hypothetical protein TNCV_635351 [Trichonephila clavipes]|nr:hypothetical protein TNCV_635351 [Trichonephila clavipes]